MRTFWIILLASCVWSPRSGCLLDTGDNKTVGVSPGFARVDTGFDTGSEECTTELLGSWPQDGATGVYIGSPVIFTLLAPDSTAKVETAIEGSTSISEDGLTITFTPAALEPETSYEVSLATCNTYKNIDFTTSSIGKELEVPVDGLGWSIDAQTGRVDDPTSTWLLPYLGRLRVGVEGELLRFGAEGAAGQDWCAPTGETALDPDALPAIKAEDLHTSISMIDEEPLGVFGLTAEGMVSPDGRAAVLSLSGAVLADQLAERLPELWPSGAALCAAVRAQLGDCSYCDGELCVPFTLSFAEGEEAEAPVSVPGWSCEGCEQQPPEEGAACE